jgi:hypothetical protein
VFLLNECLLLLFLSLSTQSGNIWIHPHILRINISVTFILNILVSLYNETRGKPAGGGPSFTLGLAVGSHSCSVKKNCFVADHVVLLRQSNERRYSGLDM